MALINFVKEKIHTTGVYTTPVPLVSQSPTGASNPALVLPYPNSYNLAVGVWPRKTYTVQLADLVALGAFTTGDIILDVLPPGTVIQRTLQKHGIAPTDAVGGTGANVLLSAATSQIVTVNVGSASGAGANHSYGTAFSVFSAPSATSFDFDGLHPAVENFATSTWLLARLTVTSVNFSALTNGLINYWVDYQIVGL